VQADVEAFCSADGEDGAGAGQDDRIVGGPEGGELDLFELVEVLVEILDEGVIAAHLFAAFEGGELGSEGAVVGGGEGDETGDAIEATQPLEIIAADDAAHTVADEIEGLVGGEGAGNVVFELLRQHIQGGRAVTGQEIEAIDIPALGFKVRSQLFEHMFCVPEAVDEDDGVAIGGGHDESGEAYGPKVAYGILGWGFGLGQILTWHVATRGLFAMGSSSYRPGYRYTGQYHSPLPATS
jgi:hypothetical protein